MVIGICLSGSGAGAADVVEYDPGRCAQSGTRSLCCDMEFPEEGKTCLITLYDGGAPVIGALVMVTYRPGSNVAATKVAGTTDGTGEIEWIPDHAGIATLEVEGDDASSPSLTVSVRFRNVPTLGVILLMLAGMILFGGNGYSIAKTFGRS